MRRCLSVLAVAACAPMLVGAAATEKAATLAPAPSVSDEIARNHFRDQIRTLQLEVKALNETLSSEKKKGLANEEELKKLRLNEKALKDLKAFEKKQTAALEKQKLELKACVHDARNKCMWLDNALDCEAAKFAKCFGEDTEEEEEEPPKKETKRKDDPKKKMDNATKAF